MVGDSTAEALGVGLAGWAGAHPTLADVRLAVSPGCGFVRGGEVATDGDVPFAERCDEILERRAARHAGRVPSRGGHAVEHDA